ncbi:hypothetical protein QJS10_CPB22g00390 [Acorus calamus]|uniref:Bifunctional inhibitor/plant lipid transfer protein/seed storage helical domain-containing protein n=1 Tax=Acorus calamus TaxID=4465 RepID=A0AAV9C1E7_ACOCL|nr:hypothetical protein QJS10_CPB22g00390 [Acorus calamus]
MSRNTVLLFVVATMLVALPVKIYGQISTACTSAMISSFTPCFNFITGSSANGASPTSGCCEAMRSLVSNGGGCICLIFMGNVPLNLPINRTLAISLPRLCNSASVPLQCKATATPLPAPGPVTFGPGLPPRAPLTPVVAIPPAESTSPSPSTSTDVLAPPPGSTSNQGLRPLVLPSSAFRISHSDPSFVALLVLGLVFLKFF